MRLPTRPALAAAVCGLVVAGSSVALSLGGPAPETVVALPRFAPNPTTTSAPTPTVAVPVEVPVASPAPTTVTPKPRRAAPRTAKPTPTAPPTTGAAPAPDTAVAVDGGSRARQFLRAEQQQFLRRLRSALPWWPGI